MWFFPWKRLHMEMDMTQLTEGLKKLDGVQRVMLIGQQI